MTRVTLRLIDGSKVSIVTDEVRCVSVGGARLGPPRIAVHPHGLPEATAYACPDFWSSILSACKGLEIVDGDPIVMPPSPVIAMEGKEARADDQGDDDDDDEVNPGPSSSWKVCVRCGEREHSNASTCPALTWTRE